jgi:hypothetical protein
MVQIINYGFVVRGVIDGGTRRCCLLTVSNSNNPTGWCKDFISAIRERFWRDWREKCGQAYLQLFELMVNDHDMDMTNPFHKYCLQAMFFTSLQDFEIHGTIT